MVVHEDDVSSAMLGGISRRWDARIATYSDEEELADELRQFVARIMHQEATGDLEQLGE